MHWREDTDMLELMARYAVAEDEHKLASAYWVWKQACGDPQNGIGHFGNGIMMQDCLTSRSGDVSLPPKYDLLEILSRAYPQQAAGTITWLESQGATMTLTGTSESHSCDLRLWVPGEAEPNVTSVEIKQVSKQQVAGGWIISGCAEGDYSISTD